MVAFDNSLLIGRRAEMIAAGLWRDETVNDHSIETFAKTRISWRSPTETLWTAARRN